jgi:hypothetical protein
MESLISSAPEDFIHFSEALRFLRHQRDGLLLRTEVGTWETCPRGHALTHTTEPMSDGPISALTLKRRPAAQSQTVLCIYTVSCQGQSDSLSLFRVPTLQPCHPQRLGQCNNTQSTDCIVTVNWQFCECWAKGA